MTKDKFTSIFFDLIKIEWLFFLGLLVSEDTYSLFFQADDEGSDIYLLTCMENETLLITKEISKSLDNVFCVFVTSACQDPQAISFTSLILPKDCLTIGALCHEQQVPCLLDPITTGGRNATSFKIRKILKVNRTSFWFLSPESDPASHDNITSEYLDGIMEPTRTEPFDTGRFWIYGCFGAVIQMVGWLSTTIYLGEKYSSNSNPTSSCSCSGIIAYTFTAGLAAIPHLILAITCFYWKMKQRRTGYEDMLF